MIRGPGAVFYGTQASGGVFNVVTRKDTDASSVFVKIGSNNLKEASGYANWELSGDSVIYAALEIRREEGYTATYNEVFPNVGLVTDDVTRYLEKDSGILRYTNEELVVQFQAFSSTSIGINDAYTDEKTLQPAILDSQGYLIHLENTWSTPDSRTTAFFDYNYYTFDLQLNNIFAPGANAIAKKDDQGEDDYRARVGGNMRYKIYDALDLSAGIELEIRSNDNYRLYSTDSPDIPLATFLEKGTVNESSLYTQLDYSFDNWKIILGARLTDNEISGHKITPRTAIHYKLDEHQSWKFLYSTGFNSPNPIQTSINAAGNVIGNDKLTAEVVKTKDIAYSFSKDNILFVANIYSFEAEDFIIRRFSDAVSAVSFFNEGNYKRQGAELDFQMAHLDSKLFVNLAYQKQGNKVIANDPDAFNTPKLTLSLGGNTRIGKIHDIGASISYIGERHNLDSYSVLNMTYSAKFSDFDVFATVRNLTNENILNPNNTTQNSDLVAQGEQGRNVQLGIRVYF